MLKPQGSRCGQFGKKYLGDRNEHPPTAHGFDEFYGNLHHLNTEEEPELADWPKDEGFNKRHRPRGVLDCLATDVDDPTVDDEFMARSEEFVASAVKDGKPFFIWNNPTRMRIYTHLREENRQLAAPCSSELDMQVGRLLKKLDDLKVTENTIVIFSTDNGAMVA